MYQSVETERGAAAVLLLYFCEMYWHYFLEGVYFVCVAVVAAAVLPLS